MKTINLRRRLEALEKGVTTEPIVLRMPDGRTETLRGDVLDLFSRAVSGERTPEMELISQSISSVEPGGAHMIDLARALLNGPMQDTYRSRQVSVSVRDGCDPTLGSSSFGQFRPDPSVVAAGVDCSVATRHECRGCGPSPRWAVRPVRTSERV